MIKTPNAELEGTIEDGWVCVSLRQLSELHGWTLEMGEEIITVQGNHRTVTIRGTNFTIELPDGKSKSDVPVKVMQDGMDLFIGYDFISGGDGAAY